MSAGRSEFGLFVILAALLMTAVAVACGDGGGPSGGSETPSGTATVSATGTPGADGAGGNGGNGGNGGDAGDGDQAGDGGDGNGADTAALQDLAALAARASQGAVGRVTYKYTSQAGGQKTEVEWVLVQRPPDVRYEIVGEVEGESYHSIVIKTEKKSYLCFARGSEGSCLDMTSQDTEGEAAAFDPLLDVPAELAKAAEAAATIDLVGSSQRKIAGIDASCFKIGGGVPALGEGEVCFSDDGFVLLLDSKTSSGSLRFEATSVSAKVTDADFDPPYKLREFPTSSDLEMPASVSPRL